MTHSVPADPAGMRAYADQLRKLAERIGAMGESVDQRAHDIDFQGPAADRFRQ